MDQEIMVTICCITYNQEKYISQTIESFLMQETNFKYEIIIHDDASTDNTTEIIRRYEEKFPDIIKPIYQVENQYSRGIIPSQIVYKKARGKYITICEGDDYWSSKFKLQKQFDFLEKNQDYIATAHWCEVVDQNNNISDLYKNKYEVFNFKKDTYTLEDYKRNIIPGHVNTLMFRNIYIESKYDYGAIYSASKLVGDRTTYLILVLSGKVHVIHEVMSCYRFICNDKGTNYCSLVKDKNQYYDWYNYYNNLEKYCYKIMNKKVDLGCLKGQNVKGAIYRYISSHDIKDKEVLEKIKVMFNYREKVKYKILLPLFITKASIKKIIYKS